MGRCLPVPSFFVDIEQGKSPKKKVTSVWGRWWVLGSLSVKCHARGAYVLPRCSEKLSQRLKTYLITVVYYSENNAMQRRQESVCVLGWGIRACSDTRYEYDYDSWLWPLPFFPCARFDHTVSVLAVINNLVMCSFTERERGRRTVPPLAFLSGLNTTQHERHIHWMQWSSSK